MFDPRMVTMSAEQARMIGNERSTRKTRWHTNKTIKRLNKAIVHALKRNDKSCIYIPDRGTWQYIRFEVVQKHFVSKGYEIKRRNSWRYDELIEISWEEKREETQP